MSTIQLTLFTEPDQKLRESLVTISAGGARAPQFNEFVGELGAHITMSPPGSIIIAAVPNHQATVHVCDALNEYLSEAEKSGLCHGPKRAVCIEIPFGMNAKAQHNSILDAYCGLPVARVAHIHNPQYALEYGAATAANADAFQRIASIIENRDADYYLVQNAQYLTKCGSSINEQIDQLRYFIQLSRASGKTHVLFASAVRVQKWLHCDETRKEVTACWLRPYGTKDKRSRVNFKGILSSYDRDIPRAEGFELLAHADSIWDKVYGCPYRLNRWLVRAVTGALSRGHGVITSDDLRCTAPTVIEAKQALAELLAVPNINVFTEVEEKRRKKTPRPGQRRLGRDPAGYEGEAAA